MDNIKLVFLSLLLLLFNTPAFSLPNQSFYSFEDAYAYCKTVVFNAQPVLCIDYLTYVRVNSPFNGSLLAYYYYPASKKCNNPDYVFSETALTCTPPVDPVCSSTEQLINHQCVADPTCSATEQLINHQCVADPTCSATEQMINHQCVADPVCSATEQLINHQCVADPICSTTEQLINHQCVADPVCSSTEQLINHQCVADPVCSSTEQLINHQCVADPTCSATEQLINHQCVANQNTDANSDFKFQTNATTVYYTQIVVGTKLVTKLGTSSGAALATQANDTPLTPYVGLYVDPADGAVYYSYKAVLDVGSGETIPISLKRRISYDSIADMIVHYQLNSALFTAKNNYFQWLSDFFISSAEANPLAVAWTIFKIANAIATAYGFYQIGKQFFKKPPEGAMVRDCTKGGKHYSSPEAACADSGIYIDFTHPEAMPDGGFGCASSSSSGYAGFVYCSNLGPAPDEPTSPGDIGRQIAIDFKDRTLLGKINNILNAMATMVDIVKAIHDAYQHFSHEKPSPKKPTGDAEMPSSPADHKPEFGKDPVDLKKPKGDTKTDPVDLTKQKGSSTKTKPDGSQTKEDEQIKVKTDPEWPDEITSEIEVTVETFSPDGSSSGQTFERRSPESSYEPDSPGGNDPPPVDLCAKDPTIIACSHWGDPGTPEEIKTHEIEAEFAPEGGDSGSCPSDKALSMKTVAGFSFSYAPVCQFAGYVKPIVVIFALIGAGYIMFGAVKES